MAILHILNGDATLGLFEKSGLKGKAIVWREILCEGPAISKLEQAEFWELRKEFLKGFAPENFEAFCTQLYQDFYLLTVNDWEEIVLWFEYDLFCQLNMLALLSLLKEKAKPYDTQISLICVGRHKSWEGLKGLGEFAPSAYPSLFEKRKSLSSKELLYASKIWELYSSGQQELLFEEDLTHPTFLYLKEALLAHFMRFPQKVSGLNEIETYVLSELNHRPQTKPSLIGNLLRRDNFYGFGDVQYEKAIDNLSMLYYVDAAKLYLNDLGEKLLNGRENFQTYRKLIPLYGQNSLLDYVRYQGKLIPA